MNQLYYGDNLDILRRYIEDESVDLVYLDPPFKSSQDYNVLFAEKNGTQSAAQIKAFEDTWHWDQGAAQAYEEMVEGGGKIAQAMMAFRTFLGESDMMAYLAMMAPRLTELRRVMASTGSIYLHCDPTASHYLKMLMDAVFGPANFRSEIVWKRTSAHSDTKQGRKQHGNIHDVLLFYTKTESWTWNPIYTKYDEDYMNSFYRHVEAGTTRRYRLSDLTAAKPGGDTKYEWRVKRKEGHSEWEADLEDEHKKPRKGYEYKGIRPYEGRFWAYSRKNMASFAKEARLEYARSGMPSYKRYLDEMPGVPLQDMWIDLTPIGPGAAERLGYPTQKPKSLLERIIQSSSNEGQTILDPFCGCGTTIEVAESLNRRWIGIDITYLAIGLMKNRLRDAFGDRATFVVVGEPTDIEGARQLAAEDPYQFQWWALDLVGARPAEQKKGADKGIDGRLYFHDEGTGGKTKQIVFSVKAGKLLPSYVRELRGVIERENAALGVLISLEEPTKHMRKEAATAGFYDSPGWGKKYPRLQLITVADLLAHREVESPPRKHTSVTFKKAPKVKRKQAENLKLPLKD